MRDLLTKLRSTRARAVLALGVFFMFAATGTWAYWTGSASVTGTTFATGTFDIKVNGADNYSTNAYDDIRLAPGESFAYDVTLSNASTRKVSWTATGTSTGSLSTEVTYRLFVGGATAAGNTGLASASSRAGTCSGAAGAAATVLGSAPTSVVPTAQTLAKGASVNVCVLVSLPSSVTTQQGQTSTPAFSINGRQVVLP